MEPKIIVHRCLEALLARGIQFTSNDDRINFNKNFYESINVKSNNVRAVVSELHKNIRERKVPKKHVKSNQVMEELFDKVATIYSISPAQEKNGKQKKRKVRREETKEVKEETPIESLDEMKLCGLVDFGHFMPAEIEPPVKKPKIENIKEICVPQFQESRTGRKIIRPKHFLPEEIPVPRRRKTASNMSRSRTNSPKSTSHIIFSEGREDETDLDSLELEEKECPCCYGCFEITIPCSKHYFNQWTQSPSDSYTYIKFY